MWSPTHIKVTIRGARGLLIKGKNNTNNCFVTIGLGKERYQTSIKDKAEANVTWNEECELKIPDQGNRAELVLTCLHRNNLGLDEFLGQVTLPLNEMDVYERPRPRWFKLESKPGKEKKNKERGELDVLISFTVKSGSLTDLSKKEKHKSSIGQLASSVGGSLLSIGTLEKRKGIKKFAKSLGSKMHLNKHKKPKDGDDSNSYSGSFASIGTPNREKVIDSEEEDDFQFDNLSQKSSVSSLNIRDSPRTAIHNSGRKSTSPAIGTGTGTGTAGKGATMGGKEQQQQQQQQQVPQTLRNNGFDNLSVDSELERLENDFSIRGRTLPPPSKPPRVQQLTDIAENGQRVTSKLDEWEEKLYGRHADMNGKDSLKRRSWEPACVPLPAPKEEELEEIEIKNEANIQKNFPESDNIAAEEVIADLKVDKIDDKVKDLSSTSSSDECEEVYEPVKLVQTKEPIKVLEKDIESPPKRPSEINLHTIELPTPTLVTPECEKNEFNKFNASFAEFEQRHGDKIYDLETETKTFLQNESNKQQNNAIPPAKLENGIEIVTEKHVEEKSKISKEHDDEVERFKVEEDLKRREAKRQEEDQRILNFAKRFVSPINEKPEINVNKSVNLVEDHPSKETNHKSSSKVSHGWIFKPNPDQTSEKMNSPKKLITKVTETSTDERERERFNNQLNFIKQIKQRENLNGPSSASTSPQAGERIIIGHEKSTNQADRRSEISAALAKKYDGKSREELMLIANGMENEALLQRQRVKELEDYLDNLLLRVMETHPKLLQNPYSRTTSAKSG